MKQSFHTASKPFSESDQRRGNFSAIQIREKLEIVKNRNLPRGFKMNFKNFKFYPCKTQTMKSSNLLFAKPKLCRHLILEYT